MPARSTFTEQKREIILRALRVGASRNIAAALAGVPEGTFYGWLSKGKAASEGTRFREFYEAVQEAEAAPRMRALSVVYRELPDNPMLAWKFLERREPGFQPPGRQRGDEQLVGQEQQKTMTDELAVRRRRLT